MENTNRFLKTPISLKSQTLHLRGVETAIRAVSDFCLAKGFKIIGSDIRIKYETNGQPYAQISSGEKYSVSISHTKGLVAAAATTADRRIGIDVEYMRNFDERFRRGFLTESEILEINKNFQNPALGETVYWSCKEAYLKATGKGLRQNPKSINVHSTAFNGQIFLAKIFDNTSGFETEVSAKIMENYITAIVYI